MRKYWPLFIPLVLVGFAVFVFIGGEVVMLLWNWLAPPLFGLPELTFWQALGMLAICRILFGGFGMSGGGGRHSSYGGRWGDHKTDRWVDRFTERWHGMSPEERERFRERVRERCGFDPGASKSEGS